MSTRILVIGDVHIKNNNISDIQRFLSELNNLLLNEKFDFIVSLGDTLHDHSKLETIPLSTADDFFKLLSGYSLLFAMVGNHDYISNSQFLTDKHWLKPFKNSKYNMKVVDNVTLHEHNGNKFILVPYVPDGKFNEALDGVDLSDISLIFAHQNFNGAKMGAFITENVEDWKYSIPIVSGHIHDKQTIKTDKSYIYYTGSSMQHAFGESIDKTIADVVVLNGKVDIKEIKEIKLNLPIRKIKKLSLNRVDQYIKKNEDDIKSGIVKVKINILSTLEEYKVFRSSKQYHKYIKMGIKFDFKTMIDAEIKNVTSGESDNKKEGEERKERKEEMSEVLVKSINFFDLLKQEIMKEMKEMKGGEKNEKGEELLQLYNQLTLDLKPNLAIEFEE